MVSEGAMRQKVAALNAHVSTIARGFGLDASAHLIKPAPSDVSTGEYRVEVVVVKRTPTGPQESRKAVSFLRYEQVGTSIFDRWIREEAIPALSRAV
jgi:hypothetical protein